MHHPLDLERTSYSYLERTNPAILSLIQAHVLPNSTTPALLDIGCRCGANAQAIKVFAPNAYILGIEPNELAASLARESCDELFHGDLQAWMATQNPRTFDGVILSDVLEHVVNPVAFLRGLAQAPGLRNAIWIVSVPNYAVWYNRLRTLAGRFEYTWSGLYDRTHLRFFTRASMHTLLRYCGFEILEDQCTPSLVQSAAPLLRSLLQRKQTAKDPLTLSKSLWFRAYRRWIEPLESTLCRTWPECLGFQIVTAARIPIPSSASTP